MDIKTRFAPSPTGKLHLGGARTALFNYLFSKYNRGEFFVRIENTDIKRSTLDNAHSIEDSLNWLDIKASSKITFQSENLNRHIEIANHLVKVGFAYKCYLTNEELRVFGNSSWDKNLIKQFLLLIEFIYEFFVFRINH